MKMRKRFLGILVGLLLMLGLMLGMTMTAYATGPQALNGNFTINAGGDKVNFAPGNLQATYNGSAWSWCFAEHQWDYIGNDNIKVNGNGSVSSNCTIDLFGWSTENTSFGIHNSTVDGDYSGDFKDWGGNIGANWRTLTHDEWNYLLQTRTTTSGLRFAKAFLFRTVHGLIIFPDNYSHPDGLAAISGQNDATGSSGWNGNNYSEEDWAKMEAAGAVFLPAAGCREGTTFHNSNAIGYYQTASPNGADKDYVKAFHGTTLEFNWPQPRHWAFSVRLVKAAPSVTITPGSNMTKTTDSGATSQTSLSGAMTAVVYIADDGYYFPENYSVDAVNGISVTRNSFTQITVSGTPTADAEITLTAATAKTKETTPNATFTATGTDSGTLTDVSSGMKYSLDGGTNWTDITEASVTISSGVTPTNGIQVKKSGNGTTTVDSDPQTITVTKAETPNLTVTQPTVIDGKGTVATTTAHEYSSDNGSTWTACTANQEFAADSYLIRVKASGTALASGNQTVTIKAFISATVTFKVVNGSWNEGEGEAATADKTVTLTGYEGDTLKLTADQIPAVGTKPNDTYKAGSWDVTPSTDTAITAATTYTYTYAQKDAAVVTTAPTAKTLTYTGSAQELVTAGTAEGGTMYYALGTATEATEQYTTSIPEKTDAGTYYVWYMAKGDETHTDSAPQVVTAEITVPSTYTVTVTDDGHGTGAANPASGVTGTEVTLTNTPAEGYQFKEWQVISGGVTVADNKFTIGTANVEVKAVFEALPEGSETGDTQNQPGAPAISGSNMADVVKSVVEAIQNGTLKDVPDNVKQAVSQPGAQVTLTLVSKPLADGDVPAADKTALNEAVQANGYDGYQPFDLTLQLTVTDPATGNKVSAEIHVSSKSVTFSLEVPENMRESGRTFYLLRFHDGKVDALASTTGNTLTGESTLFSTYAIAYQDAKEQPKPVSNTFYFKKIWEGSAEKSIDFTLYSADGKVNRQGFEKHILSEKEWSYSAVFNEAGSCYVIEKPIPGYITRYVNVGEYAGITDRCCNGGTIINKKIPKTGDETPLLLWAGMLLTGAAGLTVALTVNKRRKAHR